MSRIYSTQSLESDRSTTCSPENELISESGDSWLGQNFNWLGCARYLNSLNLLSSEISNSLRIQQLTIDDFAEMLSDGEALCALVNFLAPGCIDLSRTNKQSQFKSKIIASQNIRLFLDKCKTTLNLSDDDLFTESMFGPNEFGKVIDSLSKISTSDLALKRTALLGFSAKLLFPDQNYENSNRDSQESECMYMTEEFFWRKESAQNIQRKKINDNNHSPVHTNITNLEPKTRDFIMKEILNTEQNFVDNLSILNEDFIKPLSEILRKEDKECVFMNIDKIIDFHMLLKDNLEEACKGGEGRSKRICGVFELLFNSELMQIYAEYFTKFDAANEKISWFIQIRLTAISKKEEKQYVGDILKTLEECRLKSKYGSYRLSDMIAWPSQRVFKYPLLFKELLKKTDQTHEARRYIEEIRDKMNEFIFYLNECKRDSENQSQIDKISKNLTMPSLNRNTNTECAKNYGCYIKDDICTIKANKNINSSIRSWTIILFEKALFVCKKTKNTSQFDHLIDLSEYTFSINRNRNIQEPATPSSASNNPIFLFFNPTNLEQNTLSLNHIKEPNKNYNLTFKNTAKMEEWERTLGQTFYNLRPAGYDKNQHKFELVDFVQLVKCCVCGKYLNGIFFQGYACSRCQSICHKECLINNNEICCHEDANILKNDKFDKVLDELVRKIPENRSILNSEPEEPTLLDEKIPIDKKDYLFIAKVFFPYDGKPIPPYLNQRFLELSIGQFVRVTETNFGECWKGYISEDIQTKEEIVGLFPQKYVRVWTPDEVNLENVNESNYMWYLSAEREYAELILRRLSESSEKLASSTLFLLRPKQDLKHKDSCAAISFMYNKVVNHVLVKNDVDEDADEEIDPQTNETKKAEKYYISKIKFNSIVELVNYYRKNSLSEIISDFNTTLEIPYLQVLPNSIGKVIAQENYIPPGSNKNIANQIKLEAGRHYFLVRKESNAWWLIYNQEGLLGLAPVSYLKECNNKTSFLRNKSNIRNSDI